jgi:hypothetical protein
MEPERLYIARIFPLSASSGNSMLDPYLISSIVAAHAEERPLRQKKGRTFLVHDNGLCRLRVKCCDLQVYHDFGTQPSYSFDFFYLNDIVLVLIT